MKIDINQTLQNLFFLVLRILVRFIMVNFITFFIFLLFACLHVIGEALSNLKIRYITKPLLMPMLMVFYILSQDSLNIWVILAIVGGFLGDIFLMIPDPNKTRKYFKLGLISFLLGHIFYIFAFFNEDFNSTDVFETYLFLLWFVDVAFGVIIFLKLRPHIGQMKIPVGIYVIVIVTMSITSTFLFDAEYINPAIFCIIGATIFMISDAINAYNKFVREIKNERIYTMTSYLLGQLLLIIGFIIV